MKGDFNEYDKIPGERYTISYILDEAKRLMK